MNIHNIGDQPAFTGAGESTAVNLTVQGQRPKPWYKSKTVIASVLGLLIAIAALPEVGAIVPADWLPYLYAFSSILGVVLRAVTDKPIGSG